MEYLFDAVLDLSRTLSLGIQALLADLGLSHARWQVLKWVVGGEDRTAGGIAVGLGHSRQAVQRIANELRELGLIKIDARVRRSVAPRMQVTSQGLEVYHEADARILAWCEHLQVQFHDYELVFGRDFVARFEKAAVRLDDELINTCQQNAAAIRRETDT
jgi:DNA-binding MarR family transcriptional regulator